MTNFEAIAFYLALISLVITAISSVWYLIALRKSNIRNKYISNKLKLGQKLTFIMLICSVSFLSLTIIARVLATGHGPFSNMFEFALSFAWGIVALGLFYWWRYKVIPVSSLSSIIALALMVFASTLSSKATPLVPALQQSFLLSTHVAAAVIAYGAFSIGFIAAILYLVKQRKDSNWLPETEQLDRISYQTVTLGFPFLTLTIILGAIWAQIAWGRYWDWDPKETASLVTWLFYAGYLHSRLVSNWRGSRSAILLIIGFIAVIFTFLGNYIFAGLHAYQ